MFNNNYEDADCMGHDYYKTIYLGFIYIFIISGVTNIECAPYIPPKEGPCPPRDQWANKCPPHLYFRCVPLRGFHNRSVHNCYLYHIPKGTYLGERTVNGKVLPWPANCPINTFNPDEDWTNTTSTATLHKSCKSKTTCAEEGEYVFDNGTITTDRRCACKFEEGWVSDRHVDTFTDNDPLPDCHPVSCPAGKELKNARDGICLPCDESSFKEKESGHSCTIKKKCIEGVVYSGNTTHDRICKEDNTSVTMQVPAINNASIMPASTTTVQTHTKSTTAIPEPKKDDWSTPTIIVVICSIIGVILAILGFNYREKIKEYCGCCCSNESQSDRNAVNGDVPHPIEINLTTPAAENNSTPHAAEDNPTPVVNHLHYGPTYNIETAINSQFGCAKVEIHKQAQSDENGTNEDSVSSSNTNENDNIETDGQDEESPFLGNNHQSDGGATDQHSDTALDQTIPKAPLADEDHVSSRNTNINGDIATDGQAAMNTDNDEESPFLENQPRSDGVAFDQQSGTDLDQTIPKAPLADEERFDDEREETPLKASVVN